MNGGLDPEEFRAVVVPTYNEAESIEALIEAIRRRCIHVVVVDDNSPDGTWSVVEKLQKSDSKIHLIRRMKERGRGSAGVAGFKLALEIGASYIGEMDADFSHDPRYLPDLFHELHKADVAIGSRRARGGGESGRSWLRRLMTRVANWFTRKALGLNILDCDSGFRVFRRTVFNVVPLEGILSTGPGIIHELLYRCHLEHLRIVEYPIHFIDRAKGKSKLTIRHLIDGFKIVIALRWLFTINRQ